MQPLPRAPGAAAAMPPSRAGDVDRGRLLFEAAIASMSEPPPVQIARTLELHVSLPEGDFDFTHLVWVERISWVGQERRRELVLEALIPRAALERFLRGEALRCNCDHFRTSGANKATGYCLYKCACSGRRAAICGPRMPNKRGRGLTKSKKVNCPARFSVTKMAGTVLLRYLCPSHADLCRVQTPRCVAPEVKDRAMAWLKVMPELNPLQLVEKNVIHVSEAYAEENGCTPAEAIKSFNEVRPAADTYNGRRASARNARARRGTRTQAARALTTPPSFRLNCAHAEPPHRAVRLLLVRGGRLEHQVGVRVPGLEARRGRPDEPAGVG